MAETVHDYVASFQVGQTKRLPLNVTAREVKDYGWSRFRYFIRDNGDGTVTRHPRPYLGESYRD